MFFRAPLSGILVDLPTSTNKSLLKIQFKGKTYLFSIYRTDLFVNSFIPFCLSFETVGAFQTFYIYAAEKQ